MLHNLEGKDQVRKLKFPLRKKFYIFLFLRQKDILSKRNCAFFCSVNFESREPKTNSTSLIRFHFF